MSNELQNLSELINKVYERALLGQSIIMYFDNKL